MTPEGIVKANVKKILDRYKKEIWYFMPVSGGMGQHGIPDFICCVKGWFFVIECKADIDSNLTSLQAMQLSRIQNAGGISVMLYAGTEETAERYIQLILGRPPHEATP